MTASATSTRAARRDAQRPDAARSTESLWAMTPRRARRRDVAITAHPHASSPVVLARTARGPAARRRVRVDRDAHPRLGRSRRPTRPEGPRDGHAHTPRRRHPRLLPPTRNPAARARRASRPRVRCFADPGSHRREDRDPSCSVNVINGAWQCHGCGARGGAYDAALANGHTPRSAIDLMITHGLIERRAQLRTARELLHTAATHQPCARGHAQHTPRRTPGTARNRSGHRSLAEPLSPAAPACSPSSPTSAAGATRRCARSSSASTAAASRSRSATPAAALRGVLRYQPEPDRRARKCSPHPAPASGSSPTPPPSPRPRILLVEGPPDMIAARSRGLAAIAVPGDHAWQPAWAQLLTGRRVAIVMDADEQGRAASRADRPRPSRVRRRADRRTRATAHRWIRPHGLATRTPRADRHRGAQQSHPR